MPKRVWACYDEKKSNAIRQVLKINDKNVEGKDRVYKKAVRRG